MSAKVGYAEGKCQGCGKTLMRKRPSDLAVCDCYLYCPLCGKEMEPFNPATYPLYPYALNFDGINDYLEILHSTSLDNISTEYTILMWYKISAGPWQALICRDTQLFFNRFQMRLTIQGLAGNFDTYIGGNDGTEIQLDYHSMPTDGKLHFIGFSAKSNDKLKLYVDGKIVKEVDFPKTLVSSTRNVQVGRLLYNSTEAFYYNGLLDEIYIYNRALSADEIQKIYEGEDNRNGLILQLNFDKKNAEDASGQGNDGTIYGATFVEGGRPVEGSITPLTYESEKGIEVFYVCNNHTPPCYSKQKPVEVRLS